MLKILATGVIALAALSVSSYQSTALFSVSSNGVPMPSSGAIGNLVVTIQGPHVSVSPDVAPKVDLATFEVRIWKNGQDTGIFCTITKLISNPTYQYSNTSIMVSRADLITRTIRQTSPFVDYTTDPPGTDLTSWLTMEVAIEKWNILQWQL